MKFCTNCGAQNEDNALKCVQCQSYLANANMAPVRDLSKSMNIFGMISGIVSVILGVITFTKAPSYEELRYLLMQELGAESELIFDFAAAPAEILSFSMGSLLVVFGLTVVFFFIGKLIKK